MSTGRSWKRRAHCPSHPMYMKSVVPLRSSTSSCVYDTPPGPLLSCCGGARSVEANSASLAARVPTHTILA
ncbi:hypothetical protein K438DRAFT_1845122 [Mycena galopus ATCC 62051]|nr:hypothetical protein K438DRAFT_1845122 [Mycena galopus ATCC 62051]